MRRVLRALPVDETVAFFRELGVPLHEEAGGKLFPRLQPGARRAGRADVRAHGRRRDADGRHASSTPSTRADGDGFALDTSRGPLTARRVVLATGGRSLPKTGSDGGGYEIARALGHTLVPPTPALAPLVLDAGHRLQHSPRPVGHRRRRRGLDLDRRRAGDAAVGRAALDALRHQRPGRAQRVAALGARAPRGAPGAPDAQPASAGNLRGRRGPLDRRRGGPSARLGAHRPGRRPAGRRRPRRPGRARHRARPDGWRS